MYQFRGISQEQLDLRFADMVALFTRAIQNLIPNKADWVVRIVSVGNRDVKRLLSTSRALQGDGPIDVQVELTNTNICESDDGCGDSDQSESYQAGLDVLSDLVETAKSGALMSAILEGAKAAGLDDLVSGLTVDEVETQDPQTEVVDSTSSPTSASATLSPSPPSATPRCRDSSLGFRVMYNDRLLSKSCEWVAHHPTWKCELEGVSEHCPNTCGSCDTCSDSTVVFYHEDNDQKTRRQCWWVARKDTDSRCAIPGIADTCRSTCNNCGCSDVASFTFNLDNGKEQDCAWFTENSDNISIRRDKYCFAADGVTASTIGSNCQYGCGFCSGDTLSPTKAPTRSPSAGGCSDNASFEFLLGSGKTQNCAWLTKRNSVTRTAEYCSRGDVKGACQNACDFCACEDDSTTTFPLKNQDKSQNCAWIAKKNVVNRQGIYCYDTVDPSAASDIGDSCVSSCGFCI